MTTALPIKEIQTSLDQLPSRDVPTLEGIKGSNYKLFAMAPYWHIHQAACILTGLKTIDSETFLTLVHLNKIQLMLNSAFQEADKLDSSKKLADREGFTHYLIRSFPIPHDSITFIRNFHEKLTLSVKNGELKFIEQRHDDILVKLLLPEDVVAWAKKETIDVPPLLIKGIKSRISGKLLHLPKIFPDEINFYSKFLSLKIEQNKGYPLSLSSVSTPMIADVQPSTAGDSSDWQNLSTEELKRDSLSLIYYVVSPRGNELSDSGIAQVRDELQKRAPCPKTLFQKTTWSSEEAFLAYHNINPDVVRSPNLTSSNSLGLCRQLIHLLDREGKIYENLSNYIEHLYRGKICQALTQEQFIIFLNEKGYAIPSHFQSFKQKEAVVEGAEVQPLVGRTKELFEDAREIRCDALNHALEKRFLDKNVRAKHLDLIGTLGVPSVEEFQGRKGPRPKMFHISHRCRVVGKLLRHLDTSISIHEIYEDEVMKSFYGTSNVKLRTFKEWMWLEGIYDRKRRKSA